jgi:hypothetical protein
VTPQIVCRDPAHRAPFPHHGRLVESRIQQPAPSNLGRLREPNGYSALDVGGDLAGVEEARQVVAETSGSQH